MGGYGSGGRNKTHCTVENYDRVDSFDFWSYLSDCWMKHCGVVRYHGGAILFDLETEKAQIRMGKQYWPLEMSWVLGIDMASLRAYFYCPQCKGRVRYLYNYHGYHVCRHCLKANYKSQQRNRGAGAIRRRMQHLIEDELEYRWWRLDNPGAEVTDLTYIPKPRYMRWEKYSQLMMKYQTLQDEYTRAMIKDAWGFMPSDLRLRFNEIL